MLSAILLLPHIAGLTPCLKTKRRSKTRLSLLRQLDNPPDKVAAAKPYQSLRIVDLNHAAKWCADDPKCTGVCFSSETGWARFYHSPIQQYTRGDGTQGWVCLSLKGIGPPGTGMRSQMRPCFRSLEEISKGAWQPSQVPRDVLQLPDGSWVNLRLTPQQSKGAGMPVTSVAPAQVQAPCAVFWRCRRRHPPRKNVNELCAFL
mmetsp:Transcript_40560/g.94176  ORF Transcript_40560/g.94176 Transcript_40560/m.94176 type:complete len:203 (+) Transcript_40560:126-734(+)